jgi:hypothetical protein
MNLKLSHRFGLAALVVGVVVLGVAALSSALSSSSTIYACKRSDGTIHLINRTDRCPSGQKLVTWNTTGPAGPTGLRGPAGPPGAPGMQGAPGDTSQLVRSFWLNRNSLDPLRHHLLTVGGTEFYAYCSVASGPTLPGSEGDVRMETQPDAEFYTQGVYTRPGVSPLLPTDPRSFARSGTSQAGSTDRLLASVPLAQPNGAGDRTLQATWSGTVTSWSYTFWIHGWVETSQSGCRFRGIVLAFSNAP